MFSYTVSKVASEEAFEKACRLLEDRFAGIDKEKMLEDVDGTAIQVYRKGTASIKVYNDYEIDAVYVDSEIELKNIFKHPA